MENKPVVYMTDWSLYVYAGQYKLSGVADEHPRLGKNSYVAYTSSLERFSFEEDVLTYETRNTIYICQLKYMRVRPYNNVVSDYKEKLSHLDDKSDNMLDKIIAATARLNLLADKCIEETEENSTWIFKSEKWDEVGVHAKDIDKELDRKIIALREAGAKELAEAKEREINRLLNVVQQYEDSVYLEVSKPESGDILAYHLDKDMGIIEPRVHASMFQDSVLYMKWETADSPNGLDFRYFPKGWFVVDEMETYSWSDNIKQVVIKNVRDVVLTFNRCKIAPGETKVFTQDTQQRIPGDQEEI